MLLPTAKTVANQSQNMCLRLFCDLKPKINLYFLEFSLKFNVYSIYEVYIFIISFLKNI